jgi:hypothetical protein
VLRNALRFIPEIGINLKIAIYISILAILISCNNEKKEPNPLVITYHQKGIEFRLQNETDSAIVYFKKALNIDRQTFQLMKVLLKRIG